MSSSATPPSRIPDELTAADFDSYVSGLNLKPSPTVSSSVRDDYRAAAAVLAAIQDPDKLVAASGATGQGELALEGDLVPTSAGTMLGGTAMLRFDLRTKALRKLGSAQAMLKALDANPSERRGPVQTAFESYLNGNALPLSEQSIDQLTASAQALIWLDGLNLPDMPKLDEARVALARARFRQPFDRLAGTGFRGRSVELDRLRTFVGVLPPETVGGRIRGVASSVPRLFGLKPQQALSLYGPGGIGKTALLMRFFLEHIGKPEGERVPFAYLDFDSPLLDINDLSTIAAEMFRQLALQFPGISLPPLPSSADAVGKALGELLRQVSVRANQPYLVVLDTFEEVQFRGEAHAIPCWDALNALQSEYPFLRVVVSGRAPVRTLKLADSEPGEFELKGLDELSALAVLAGAGVSDQTVAEALIRQVGRIPLSLQLAAALAKKEGIGSRGIRDLETSTFFVSLSDEVIQGQLYDRILGHIHDKEVAKLAHPGLVLRRLSAKLILDVLKEPCGLSLSGIEDANALYTKLALETALVTEESGGWLRHRQDLRRTMLKLVADKQPALAEQIHRRAAEWYRLNDSPDGPADQIYHRLMLRETPYDDGRTLRLEDVRKSLSQSLKELPVESQVFLAEFGYEVTKDVLKLANETQIENHGSAQIEDLLPHGPTAYGNAEKLLSEYRYRGKNSPLYLSAARLLFLTNRDKLGSVIDLVGEGLRFASEAGDLPRVLDLLCLECWALEETNDSVRLVPALQSLKNYAYRLERNLAKLQYWAQVSRLPDTADKPQHAEIISSLEEGLMNLPERDFRAMAPALAGVFARVSREPLRRLAPAVAWAGLEPMCLEPLLPLIQSLTQGRYRPHSEVRLEELRSPESVSSALFRLTNYEGEETAGRVGAAIDEILRSWPQRLIYLYLPEPGRGAA